MPVENIRRENATKRGSWLRLLSGTAICCIGFMSAALAPATPALAQSQAGSALAARSFDIPAQPLTSALTRFGRQSGLQVSFPTEVPQGLRSQPVVGSFTPQQALGRLLQGTGIPFRFAGQGIVLVGAEAASASAPAAGTAPVVADGSTLLKTITVSGGGSAFWDGSPENVYNTTANVTAITRETLETYNITSPSDVLRSTTGVISGEGRNSGALDVNIHGMQGQGRVAVTVDGAENETTVYRGYQGVAGRSYIDPDFISTISIEKGASASRSGIGGAVNVTTITVEDVVKEGRTTGFRLKTSVMGNGSDPVIGNTLGKGASRPAFLEPTGGSGSLAWGRKGDFLDVVVGVSKRENGNYHAGTKGDRYGTTYTITNRPIYNSLLSVYGYGDEVYNSSGSTQSGIAKATFKFTDELKWQLGYSRFENEIGEVMPFWTANGVQEKLTETKLDSLTSRFRYDPAGNDWIDLRWNVWGTRLTVEDSYDAISRSVIWGSDLSNKARIDTPFGDVDWTTGISFKHEDARTIKLPVGVTTPIRDGARKETALFTTAEWQATDWLSLNAGLRYSNYESIARTGGGGSSSDDAFSNSIGLAVKPNDWLTLYANLRNAARLPSIYETTFPMMVLYDVALKPETAHNIDVGFNAVRDGLFTENDSGRLKFSYFDNKINNYIARMMQTKAPQIYMTNIDHARFKGFDGSAEYERGGFRGAISATYYTEVEFCNSSGNCSDNSLGSDFAQNHLPPKYQLGLDISQKFMDDRLTVGGQFKRIGPRATDGGSQLSGGSSLLNFVVGWKPYTTIDAYARYKVTEDVELSFDVSNITDAYYIEPLSLGQLPGPGRTARLSLDWRF